MGKCPKCKSGIKNRDSNSLALRWLFEKASPECNLSELEYCDLCGAKIEEIVADLI